MHRTAWPISCHRARRLRPWRCDCRPDTRGRSGSVAPGPRRAGQEEAGRDSCRKREPRPLREQLVLSYAPKFLPYAGPAIDPRTAAAAATTRRPAVPQLTFALVALIQFCLWSRASCSAISNSAARVWRPARRQSGARMRETLAAWGRCQARGCLRNSRGQTGRFAIVSDGLLRPSSVG